MVIDWKSILDNFENFKETNEGYELLSLAREHIFKNVAIKNFHINFILFAILVLKYQMKFSKYSSESGIRKNLMQEFSNIKENELSQHPLKLNLALMIFVTDVLQGNFKSAKENLLERIVEVNSNSFVMNNAQVQPFFQILKSIYTLDEVVEILKNKIFKGNFWNKSLISKKSAFLWVFPVLWSCFGFESNFKALYDAWLKIFYKAIQKNDTELAFFLLLPITHVWSNLSTTQAEHRKFNEEVNKPFADYVINKVIPEYDIKPNTKPVKGENEPKKIAFVYDRIVGSSPVKLLYSLLESLTQQNDGNEYYVYDLEVIEKTPSDPRFIKMIQDLGVKYISNHSMVKDNEMGVHYYSHFNKAMMLRDKIIEDDIDVLILGSNWATTIFLYATRTAPKQVFWCHGNFEFDVPGIDKRITHIPEGSPMHQNDIPFERFTLQQSDVFFQEEVEEYKKKAAEIRKKFPENAVILGSVGRLIKLEGEGYLETVAEIMKQNPDTIYIACGTGGTENIKQKIKKLGIEDRFYFEGWVDPKIYAHVIDVYLNTFPDPSGEAASEFRRIKQENAKIVNKKILQEDKDLTYEEYVSKASEMVQKHIIEKKYPKVLFTKEDFWNFTLLKDNNELLLSYDKIMVDKNLELLLEILKRYENIKIIAEGKDADRLLIKREYKDRIIIEDDVYERAYKSDFFILFENRDEMFKFTRDCTMSRFFRQQVDFPEIPHWKIAEKNYNENIKNKIFSERFGKLLSFEPETIHEVMWVLLKDCFKSKKEFEYFYFAELVKEEFFWHRLSWESSNPKLLYKIKILKRLDRVNNGNEIITITKNSRKTSSNINWEKILACN